jgi:hypothetical protein
LTPAPAHALLTPAQTLAYFGLRDRGSLRRLAERGLVERVNVGGDSPQGQRWRYRLKALAMEVQAVSEADVHYQEMKRRHGW